MYSNFHLTRAIILLLLTKYDKLKSFTRITTSL